MNKDLDHTIIIETPRLVLRPLALSDADEITRLANNWNVVKNLALLPFPYEEKHARQFIDEIGRLRPVTTFAVNLRAEPDRIIGVMGCTGPENGTCGNFGYWLGEPYWGRGFTTEAACGVIAYTMDHLGATRVLSECRPCNGASRHVLEKCGFQPAGRGTMFSTPLNSVQPVDLYTLTRDVWNNRTAAPVPVTITDGTGCTGAQTG